MELDPKITVKDALELYDGNQSALARALKLQRSSVHEWVKVDREFLPELQAHRIQKLHPEVFPNQAA